MHLECCSITNLPVPVDIMCKIARGVGSVSFMLHAPDSVRASRERRQFSLHLHVYLNPKTHPNHERTLFGCNPSAISFMWCSSGQQRSTQHQGDHAGISALSVQKCALRMSITFMCPCSRKLGPRVCWRQPRESSVLRSQNGQAAALPQTWPRRTLQHFVALQ
jgi:hypothetical protein